MRRGRVFIMLALIIILGVVAAYLLLQPKEVTPPEGEEPEMARDMVYVVVAAQDIARGSVIPSDALVIQQMPADLVVETWIADMNEQGLIEQVVDRRARMEIARGIPVTTAMITEKGPLLGVGSDAAIAIEPGFTAIAIPMTRLSGVAYAIRAGDTVDVLITLLMVDLDIDFQTVLPNLITPIIAPGGTEEFPAPFLTATIGGFDDQREDALPPFLYGKVETDPELEQPMHTFPQEQQRPRMVTQRLVESAIVLQVGTFPLGDGGELGTVVEEEEGIGAPPPQQGEDTLAAPQPPDIVTLIVTPQDALALNWAMKAGADLVLTLRAPGDTTSTDTITVTLQYLIDNYDITIPAKLPYGLEPALSEPIIPVLPNDTAPPQEQ